MDEGFKRFWAAFPRRQKKKDARKAWADIHPDAALVDTIIAALNWQCRQPQWLKDDGQFIPLGGSWLRGERWDDEPYENPKRSPAAIDELKAFKESVQRRRESA